MSKERRTRAANANSDPAHFVYTKTPESVDFTVIRKYLQQLIINADKQSAKRTKITNKIFAFFYKFVKVIYLG